MNSGRRLLLAIISALVPLAGTPTAPAAPQERPVADCRLWAAMSSASQSGILAERRLMAVVLVTRGCAGKLRTRGFVKRAGAKPRPVSRVRVLRSGSARSAFGLPLTRTGKRRLARCAEGKLVLRVRWAGRAVGRDRVPLRLDSPDCASPHVFELDPAGAATHTNGTPRALSVRGVAGAADVALFECGAVERAGRELRFRSVDGRADPGAPAAHFSALGGRPTSGEPATLRSVAGSDGAIEVEVKGADGCASVVAYEDANGNGGLDVDARGIPVEPYGAGGATTFEPQGVAFQNAGRCDPLDPAICLQPFPNDHFTAADPGTDTGLRVAFAHGSMPESDLGVKVNPAELNRSDGFSPGALITTKVPGLETPAAFAQTDPVPITDIARSFDADAPVVVIDAQTGERHPIWTELDANPADPADVNLLIRPAVNFREGGRYIVALRDLRDAQGGVIPAGRAFQIYRDRIITSNPAVEARRPELEGLFAELEGAGIAREDLYLAWDFTVASERNLTERMLAIRDDAFAQLGDTDLQDMEVQGSAPQTLVTAVTDYSPCGADGCQPGLQVPHLPIVTPLLDPVIGLVESVVGPLLGLAPEDDQIARRVQGEVVVPCYLDLPLCPPAAQFSYSGPRDTLPNRIPGNVALAAFECIVPRSAIAGGEARPSRPALFGHGLLGSLEQVEIEFVKALAFEQNMTLCSTDWAGFASQDLPSVALVMQDLTRFNTIPDRTQQGFLNFLFLGRSLIHPDGLGSHPAFRFGGERVIDQERLFYYGISQGGIFGGALTAVAPDFDRAVLSATGMNYSTLLRRSVDFTPYAEGSLVGGIDLPVGLYDRYPDELVRPLGLSLVQMLWDRGEANGYAHHITDDPLPNTPPHEVLMQIAFGDHQVSTWAADVEARTVGAATNPATLDPGRHPDAEPLFGIPRIGQFPYDGSAIVYFDSGTPPAPITNVPPEGPEFGSDPHVHPASDPAAREQIGHFLRIGGKVVDVCGGKPCYAAGYTGPGD